MLICYIKCHIGCFPQGPFAQPDVFVWQLEGDRRVIKLDAILPIRLYLKRSDMIASVEKAVCGSEAQDDVVFLHVIDYVLSERTSKAERD